MSAIPHRFRFPFMRVLAAGTFAAGVALMISACADEPQQSLSGAPAPVSSEAQADAVAPPVPAYGTKPPTQYLRAPIGIVGYH